MTRFLNSVSGKEKETPKEDKAVEEAFKKWCDSSVFKCQICGWEGSRLPYISHVRMNHGDFWVYRNQYGNGLHVSKEHKCLICERVFRLDHYTPQGHFKTKHKMAAIDYYKKYIDTDNASKSLPKQLEMKEYWAALKDWLSGKLEDSLEVNKLFPEFNQGSPELEEAKAAKVQEPLTESDEPISVEEMEPASNSQ